MFYGDKIFQTKQQHACGYYGNKKWMRNFGDFGRRPFETPVRNAELCRVDWQTLIKCLLMFTNRHGVTFQKSLMIVSIAVETLNFYFITLTCHIGHTLVAKTLLLHVSVDLRHLQGAESVPMLEPTASNFILLISVHKCHCVEMNTNKRTNTLCYSCWFILLIYTARMDQLYSLKIIL